MVKSRMIVHLLEKAVAITNYKYVILFVLEESNDSGEKGNVEGNYYFKLVKRCLIQTFISKISHG